MNARFVIWHNDGYVKLTLKPGQTITVHSGNYHDEGFSFTTETFTYYGDTVVNEIENNSRDCDGPLYHHSEYCFKVERNNNNEVDESGILVRHIPQWEKLSSYQRDTYAEMMGY